jgi:hypothetical protein
MQAGAVMSPVALLIVINAGNGYQNGRRQLDFVRFR